MNLADKLYETAILANEEKEFGTILKQVYSIIEREAVFGNFSTLFHLENDKSTDYLHRKLKDSGFSVKTKINKRKAVLTISWDKK